MPAAIQPTIGIDITAVLMTRHAPTATSCIALNAAPDVMAEMPRFTTWAVVVRILLPALIDLTAVASAFDQNVATCSLTMSAFNATS